MHLILKLNALFCQVLRNNFIVSLIDCFIFDDFLCLSFLFYLIFYSFLYSLK